MRASISSTTMATLFAEPCEDVGQAEKAVYEANAGKFWNAYFSTNRDKSYRDRRYLDQEFRDLANGAATVLEVGCGAGNTVFPLLEVNPQLRIYACDFAPIAVQIVKDHPWYASGQVSAFVADLTRDDLLAHVPPASVDYVTMVFVLSAVAPEQMPAAMQNIARTLRPGGRIFFRDYAEGDLAEERLQLSGSRRLSERFYVRGDGTRCFYFQPEDLVALFSPLFEVLDVHMGEKDVENRGRKITMHRKWVQGVFQLKATNASSVTTEAPMPVTGMQPNHHQHQQEAHQQAPPRSRAREGEPQSPSSNAPVAFGGQGWLVGPAGRLARTPSLPGVPSGRALLPETLEPADELVGSLSPDAKARAGSARGSARDVERALEDDFFATVQRDTQEVVSEEVDAAGIQLAGITLAGPECSAAPTAASSSLPFGHGGLPTLQPPQHSQAAVQQQQQQQQHQHHQCQHHSTTDSVMVSPNLRLHRTWPSLQGLQTAHPVADTAQAAAAAAAMAAQAACELMLARLFMSGSPVLHALVSNAEVLQLGAGPGALASMAAVRVGARRVLVTHPDRTCLMALASSLHENRSQLIVERFRVAQLIMSCPSMLFNAAEQAAAISKPGEDPGFGLVMCADLHSASAAELAQAQRQGSLGERGGSSSSSSTLQDGLAAVLRGAHLLACSAPRREKRLLNVTHGCTVSQPESAALGCAGSGSGTAGAAASDQRSKQGRVGALLLLVREGSEAAVVASTAGACGWQVDEGGSAELLASLRGESSGLLPMLLHTQT